jgi:hypothetical protein
MPPCSFNLNPVEIAFSKPKALFAQGSQAGIPGLLRRIGRIVKVFSPKNAGIFCATPAMPKREAALTTKQ